MHFSPVPTIQVREDRDGKFEHAASLYSQDCFYIRQVLKLAGRERTKRVMVVGCEHIEPLIQLAQRGFVDAACRDALTGPNAGEMAADIMVAPAVNREP